MRLDRASGFYGVISNIRNVGRGTTLQNQKSISPSARVMNWIFDAELPAMWDGVNDSLAPNLVEGVGGGKSVTIMLLEGLVTGCCDGVREWWSWS